MNLFTHKLERVSRIIFEKYASQLAGLVSKKYGVDALYDEDELNNGRAALTAYGRIAI